VIVAPSPPQLEDDEADTLLNPLVLVECLSPSTRRIDRGEKLDAYRQIPSLAEYLIVAQDRIWIDRYYRTDGGWQLAEYSQSVERIPLPAIGCELPVSEVYERVFADQ